MYSIKHASLAVKNAFIYLILILMSSFLIGYSIYRVSAALIISSSRDQIKSEVQDEALKMTTHFDHVSMDIHFLDRYVDGLHTWAPDDRQFYVNRAPQRAKEGYLDVDLYK